MFNLDWFERPFIFVSSKVPFAKLGCEDVLIKQFPKMQKQPVANVLQKQSPRGVL